MLSLILTHLLINPISTCPITWLSSTDCRGFPPTAGLSFSCWFQINRFSSACDSHPIRLLSVVRHMSRTEQQYICLSISFSAYDGCLVISTEEEAFTYLGKKQTKKMVQFFFLLQLLINFSLCCCRHDGARNLHSYLVACITEVAMLQHAGPRSVAPSDCSHGQRREEELSDLSLFQWKAVWHREGTAKTAGGKIIKFVLTKQ